MGTLDSAPTDWRDRAALESAVRRFHDRVRRALDRWRPRVGTRLREAAGDLRFPIDEVAEGPLRDLGREVSRVAPVRLVAEGAGEERFGRAEPELRVLVDPIDGSRERTFGLASAWTLVAIAPERGGAPGLRHVFFAHQGELPLPGAPLVRSLLAWRGEGCRLETYPRRGARRTRARRFRTSGPSRPGPGFYTFVRFGVADRVPIARVEEAFLRGLRRRYRLDPRALGDRLAGPTAALLLDLARGGLRLVADLRPIAGGEGPTAKAYDLGSSLCFEEAGAVLTDLGGALLDAPLDLETRVGFVAYPNAALRRALEPLLRRALRAAAHA